MEQGPSTNPIQPDNRDSRNQGAVKPVETGFFAPEKRGIKKGVVGGLLMMAIAAAWFFIGYSLGFIFYYPPILFLIGVYALIKGLVTGNIAGQVEIVPGKSRTRKIEGIASLLDPQIFGINYLIIFAFILMVAILSVLNPFIHAKIAHMNYPSPELGEYLINIAFFGLLNGVLIVLICHKVRNILFMAILYCVGGIALSIPYALILKLFPTGSHSSAIVFDAKNLIYQVFSGFIFMFFLNVILKIGGLRLSIFLVGNVLYNICIGVITSIYFSLWSHYKIDLQFLFGAQAVSQIVTGLVGGILLYASLYWHVRRKGFTITGDGSIE
jgi:hypothetical protein